MWIQKAFTCLFKTIIYTLKIQKTTSIKLRYYRISPQYNRDRVKFYLSIWFRDKSYIRLHIWCSINARAIISLSPKLCIAYWLEAVKWNLQIGLDQNLLLVLHTTMIWRVVLNELIRLNDGRVAVERDVCTWKGGCGVRSKMIILSIQRDWC